MQIGDRLREARRKRRLSLQQVAQAAGISAATLSRIETSKQSLDIKLLVRVAETLGAPAADFLSGGDSVGDVQRALERLAPEDRAALWSALAQQASDVPNGQHDPISDRLAEVVAQLDLLRAAVESMRKECENVLPKSARTAGVATGVEGR
jgi:transcriptional regulator with XRE-family HTH domain